MGYPAGAVLTLFFIGMDISPEFAADSAVYTMMGLGSLIAYTLCVSIAYPASGIYIGTLISLAAASVYLFVYRLVAVKTR